MHVANVEYSETVKKRGQLLEHNLVALDENAFRIPACSPVETGQLQCVSNDRMDQIPALYVKGEEALAEDLRLLVRLDAQSLSRVERSETFLQFAQDIFVHGITSSEIGSTFPGASHQVHVRDRPSPSAAPKAMQGDFRRTVKAHRNDAGSCAHRGVAAHVVILPGSRPHSPWQHRLQLDRNGSRKTKLATVRMAAQQQIEIGMGSLTINFRRM